MNASEIPAMHATEKILADHAGKNHVRTGEIVNCTVDIAEVNDLYLQVVRSFYEMGGTRVSSRCRLIIAPASAEVMLAAVRKGYVEALIEAGATFTTPGCGPCLGAHQGVLAPGETGITTSSRNFPGRMGSKEASIYITSPATAAATALEGCIADPRDFLPKDSQLPADLRS